MIIHELLLRKIKSETKNKIHFEIGCRFVKFGIGEFALIIGLNFCSYPEEMPHSTRLVPTYLKDNSIVKSHEFEAAFSACNDKDDA